MQETKKYVLTGPASSGKSTLINLAWQNSHYTLSEVAEHIINGELKKESEQENYIPNVPWIDLYKFQTEVTKIQKQWEQEIPKNTGITILDRGAIDGIGFCNEAGIPIPNELLENAKQTNYKKVFFLEPLKAYKKTQIRREEQEQSDRISHEIQQAYQEFGYTPIQVPAMLPQQRLEFIIARL